MAKQVVDYHLYRWRYCLGYGFVVVAIIAAVVLAGLFIPGELRQGELDSALQSSQLSFQNLTPAMVINAPYHGLQKLSFAVLGVTPLSIKLPSMAIALMTALGLLLLFRSWFSRNIALITTILVTMTAQFLFLAQDGTPAILFSCLTVWLLYAATRAIRTKKFLSTLWKVTACVLAALLLYAPLGIYVVIALGILGVSHPHARYTILRVQRSRLALAAVIGLVAMLPLIYASITNHDVLKQLFGLPLESINVGANLRHLGTTLFGLFASNKSYLVQPLYSVGMILIMLIGLASLLSHYYTARSYAALLVGLPLLGVVISNPQLVTSLFPVMAIVIAFGVAWLINHWYKMFPRNPYARVAGLLPMALLIGGLTLTGIGRYAETYRYNPEVLAHYSSDVKLLNDQLQGDNVRVDRPMTLAVTETERPMYEMIARYNDRLRVVTTVPEQQTVFTATRAYRQQHQDLTRPAHIITNARAHDSNRFYQYEPL